MSNRYFGLYRGVVSKKDDLMRIKAFVPEVLGEFESPWASPCVPLGVRTVPDVNTHVWIEFESGDPSRPIWMGTAGGEVPSVVKTMANISFEVGLVVVEGELSDGKILYLSGEGNPLSRQQEYLKYAPVGSEYSDTETGDKWMKTNNGWKKLAFVT